MTRSTWLDAVKGIGILLVVLGHVIRGLDRAGLPPAGGAYVDHLIYGFHMPLFFFASGLVARRLTRHGIGRFAESRWWTVVYPYLIWSVLQIAVNHAASGSVNEPASLGTIAAIGHKPYGQFWFLYALLICQVMGYVLLRGHIVLAAAGAILILIWPPAPIFHAAATYLPYYLLAPLLADRIEQAPPPRGWAIAAAAYVAIATAAFLAGLGTQGPAAYVIATIGIIATVGLAKALPPRAARVLAWVGALSMPIYVMHIIAGSGARVILMRLGFPPLPWIYVAITFVIGVAAPLVAYQLLARLRLLALLGLAVPSWARHRDAPRLDAPVATAAGTLAAKPLERL